MFGLETSLGFPTNVKILLQREDHSERPGGTKLQFAVTKRRSGRYGNTSRIWPSRSFRCTLRQKSG